MATIYTYLGAGNDSLSKWQSADEHHIHAGGGDDSIAGGLKADLLSGAAGNDLLQGYEGNDYLDGGTGDDRLYGMEGNDTVRGGAGNDYIDSSVWGGLGGSDYLDGGDGHDTIKGWGGDDTAYGGNGNDKITGSSGDNSLYGDAGNDTLGDISGSGSNTMAGGAGNDEFIVRGAQDMAVEQAGGGYDLVKYYIDTALPHTYFLPAHIEALQTVSWSGSTMAATVIGNAENNRLTHTAGVNVTFDGWSGNDTLTSGGGNDTLFGGTGNDDLNGNAGHDSLNGGGGHDSLYAGQGNDSLAGGAGRDVLVGGLGGDRLHGGAEADIFVFTALADSTIAQRDIIQDFQAGLDQIWLTMDIHPGGEVNDFVAFAERPALGFAGAIWQEKYAGGTMLLGDANGDTIVDFALNVAGVQGIAWTDIVL